MPALDDIFHGVGYPSSGLGAFCQTMAVMFCYQLGHELVSTIERVTHDIGGECVDGDYGSVSVVWSRLHHWHRSYLPLIVTAIEDLGYKVKVSQ
jgi:hypothetical protein